jgi:hypothetical protein
MLIFFKKRETKTGEFFFHVSAVMEDRSTLDKHRAGG